MFINLTDICAAFADSDAARSGRDARRRLKVSTVLRRCSSTTEWNCFEIKDNKNHQSGNPALEIIIFAEQLINLTQDTCKISKKDRIWSDLVMYAAIHKKLSLISLKDVGVIKDIRLGKDIHRIFAVLFFALRADAKMVMIKAYQSISKLGLKYLFWYLLLYICHEFELFPNKLIPKICKFTINVV